MKYSPLQQKFVCQTFFLEIQTLWTRPSHLRLWDYLSSSHFPAKQNKTNKKKANIDKALMQNSPRQSLFPQVKWKWQETMLHFFLMKGHIINLENKSDWLAPVWKKCTDWPPATTQVLCVTVDPQLAAFWIACPLIQCIAQRSRLKISSLLELHFQLRC